nr:MAG TPA: hypothetical protein [Caudoviricetes sp.]
MFLKIFFCYFIIFIILYPILLTFSIVLSFFNILYKKFFLLILFSKINTSNNFSKNNLKKLLTN